MDRSAAWVYSGSGVTLPASDLRMLLLDRRDWAGWARALQAAGGFRERGE